MPKYYLATNWGSEGWSLGEFGSIEEIINYIMAGNTYGRELKILKDVSKFLNDKLNEVEDER